MNPAFQPVVGGLSNLEVSWNDAERVIWRGWRQDDEGERSPVLVIAPAAERPAPIILDRPAREYEL